MSDRFRCLPLLGQHGGEIGMSVGEVIAQFHGFAIMNNRLIEEAFLNERVREIIMKKSNAKMVMRFAVVRAQFERLLVMRNRIIHLSPSHQKRGDIVVREV